MAILKFRSSSIIEVTVAMVISSMTIGAALLLFHRINQNALSLQELKAQQILHTVMEETIAAQYFTDREIEEEQLYIVQKVATHDEHLLMIRLEAYQHEEKPLAEIKRLVYVP